MAYDFQDTLDDVYEMPVLATSDQGDTRLDAVLRQANRFTENRDHRLRDPRYVTRLRETAAFLKGVVKGSIPIHYLRETLSTADFPVLFGDVVNRQLLRAYNTIQPVWRQYVGTGTVRDFRPSKMVAIDGFDAAWGVQFKKPELAGVRYEQPFAESTYTRTIDVYEKGYSLNWRMVINDDLGLLAQLGSRINTGALRTQSRLAVGAYVGAAGFNTTFFSNTNKNIINTTNGAATNNPPLSVEGLRQAILVASKQIDTLSGEPIIVDRWILVVPPALEITAMEIVNAVAVLINPGVTAGTGLQTANWAKRFGVVVDPYLPVIDQSANKDTTWYLFADPASASRPGLEITSLQGYETPMIFQKAPNSMRLGGVVDPLMGDFQDMSYHYKGVLVVGSTLVDPKMAVVSNGSGS